MAGCYLVGPASAGGSRWSSNAPLRASVRSGRVAGSSARRASWSSESGFDPVTGRGASRPSGSAAALTARSRASVRLVAVYRGGSRISGVWPPLRREPAECFTPCSMLEEREASVFCSASIMLTARSSGCVGLSGFGWGFRAAGRRGNAVRRLWMRFSEAKDPFRECPLGCSASGNSFPGAVGHGSSGNGKRATAAVMRCGYRRGVLRRV